MTNIQKCALEAFLTRNNWLEDALLPAPVLSISSEKLLRRIDTAQIYAHTYPFFFNLKMQLMHPKDLIDYAYVNALTGCALHIHDGGGNCLSNMSTKEREDFGRYAHDLGIKLSLETSHTDRHHVDEIVGVARDMDVADIRVYSRYQGKLSQVVALIINDLRYIAEKAEAHDLFFYFEQHEELKSEEIAYCVDSSGSKRIGVLFDFGNMLNAYETPLHAMRTMMPYIRQVHIKGARRVYEQGGWGQQGVLFQSDEDELPAERLLFELLSLGEEKPQVKAFILEQEMGFYAPPFRKPNEEEDPYIAYRDPSESIVPGGKELQQTCLDEYRYATDMITKLRELLVKMKTAATCSFF